MLDCLVMHDRPFNVQAVADLLATKGVKKPQAQRSLDALAQNKKIRVKVSCKLGFYLGNCVLYLLLTCISSRRLFLQCKFTSCYVSKHRFDTHTKWTRFFCISNTNTKWIPFFYISSASLPDLMQEFGKTKVYFPLHSGQVLDKVVSYHAASL